MKPLFSSCIVLLLSSFSVSEELTRLTNISVSTNSARGNVEIYFENEWRPLCARKWTLENAHVVCRSVDYPEAAKNLVHYAPNQLQQKKLLLSIERSWL